MKKYKILWEGGKNIETKNIKAGYKIRLFCVKELSKLFQENKTEFGENGKKEIEDMINELKQDKIRISPENQNCSLEEYEEFLNDFYEKLDFEDKYETVTLETSSKFRFMAYLIDVLSSWGPINESMKKRQNYCQKKCVDIFKAIKNGEIPKKEKEYKEEKNQLDPVKIEKLIKLYKNKITNLENQLNEEKNKNKELENNYNTKILELKEEIKNKDDKLKEITSQLHFDLIKGEKLMSLIFKSMDQKFNYSIICKNTDVFSRLEEEIKKDELYKESKIIFLLNGRSININETVEENKIKNNDIILIERIED